MKSMKANFSHWAMIIRIAAFSGFESFTEMDARGERRDENEKIEWKT